MPIEFQNIRPWNNSQNEAFETLCCQLAAYENAPPKSNFIRKAPPDAGIECLWTLPNGDEWGWQAKFFTSPPDERKWGQIDDSVKTALGKHPQLTSYTICLPVDRQDPRIGNEKWFMDKWNEHVEKWQRWAQEKGMSVEFKFWGDHEIGLRLSLEEHRGRYFFWFHKELFSHQWFEARIDEAVANVGARYSPELNIELPIVSLFDGLGRTSVFLTQVRVLYGKIKREFTNALSSRVEGLAKDEFDYLRKSVNSLLSCMKDIEKTEIGPFNWDNVGTLTSESLELVWDFVQKLEEKKVTSKEGLACNPPNDVGYERYYLYELWKDLQSLRDFAQSGEAHLSNLPNLLLVGGAGTGKTHLFCDVAKKRVSSGLSTVLLLGDQFIDGEPWSQIIRLLGLSCTKEEFLGALEASAQAQGSRALIFIDALNEGEGKHFWNKFVAGMLTTLSSYPWIGLAISVRTSYEGVVIPQGLVPNRLVREIHIGFAEHEYDATQTFFDYHGIEQPSIPLLVPEFQNPLFLKLFCQGLKNRNLTKIPSGLRGITTIFKFFIESVNGKLSRQERLNFDPKSQIVQCAVEKLAEIMSDRKNMWLPREDAKAAVDAFLPRQGYENTLFRAMIAEGVITEDRFRIDGDKWSEGIHFSYERFTDNLVAKHLLDKYLDSSDPSHSFMPNQPLVSLIKDEGTCWRNRGLIDAFSIQLPERIGKELAEVAPHSASYQPIRESFVESLIWRDPKAIIDATLDYINGHVIKYRDTHDQFLNALLTVASNPDHPYNADFLHEHLVKIGLAERDAWWSIFLHHQYGEHGSVDRLVDWAWSSKDKSHINDESIRLCGVALAWFLTTSNRFLRDRATKALVSLFTQRIQVLMQVIPEFLNVNDAYILERLFAVAYGCAMRSMNDKTVGELAKNVYEWIFENNEPPPNILLRDYAREVVEIALRRGIELDIDLGRIRPPYKSEWPSFEIPTEEELKKYSGWTDSMPDEEWARVHLYESVMGFEDFARYIIGANSGILEWSLRRLNETRKISRKEMYENFVKSLLKRQKQAWTRYHTTRTGVNTSRKLNQKRRMEIFKREFSDEELEDATKDSELSLKKVLNEKQLKIFEEYVIPYLNDPKDEYRFDLSIAQRWILQKVLNLGWSVKLFGIFDRNLSRYSSYGRSAHKPERIGKKYQWIAYHEFLARMSDNFEFRGDQWSDKPRNYEGPWQMFVRDIDPSFLLRKTEHEAWQPHTNTWWFPSSYNAWDSEPDDLVWLKSSEDLPKIEPLIEVMNPDDGAKWLTLEASHTWEQPTPPEEERFEIPRRNIRYVLKSYIVKKSDIDALHEWAKKQDLFNYRMPESPTLHEVFLGEFFGSPAYEYLCTPYYGYEGWTRGHEFPLPKEILVTTEHYFWEYPDYDCSIDTDISVCLPTKWLVEFLCLHWKGVEGQFFDNTGNLIAFDPSVRTVGPSALLLHRGALKALNEKGYDIIWIVTGEKSIIGGQMTLDVWKGRLEVSGVFWIHENKIEGRIKTRFDSRT